VSACAVAVIAGVTLATSGADTVRVGASHAGPVDLQPVDLA
jgi:hypothetical protein